MSNFPSRFGGGCACGAVRYETTAHPIVMLHCHCLDWQRSSGGPFSSFVVVAKEAFTTAQGDPSFYASSNEAGGMTRRSFCPECGSPLYALNDSAPNIVAIRPASLDDPTWFAPQFDVWTADARPGIK